MMRKANPNRYYDVMCVYIAAAKFVRPPHFSVIMSWLTLVQCCLLWNLSVVSSYGMQPIYYPRPALFDMQLTSSIHVSVEFSGIAQKVHTTFTFQSHSQCVRGETYNYTVLVWQEGMRQPCHIEGPFKVSSCEETLHVTAYGLHRSQHYTATVVAYNDNVSLKSKKIDLYTSAVQEVEVVKGEECVVVTCYFATGSNALGCAVHMRIVNTYTSQHLHSWQFNVTQDPDLLSGAVHVPLEPKASAVDVVVYDLTATGRVGSLSIPPHITLSANGECRLGDNIVTPYSAKAKMVLFYISASFFTIGLLVIFMGMLCKIGNFHRHFRNKSYDILEGRDITHQHSSSGSVHPDSSRRHTEPPSVCVPSSPKPRAKTYGSYEVSECPVIREIGGNGENWSVTAGTDVTSLQLHVAGGSLVRGQRRETTPDSACHSMAAAVVVKDSTTYD